MAKKNWDSQRDEAVRQGDTTLVKEGGADYRKGVWRAKKEED